MKHRYALALHTDEPHPHVHLVLKAVSERGVRLNIRKATLREWRREFARHLRAQGVAANATERAVRGDNRTYKRDGIYRANERGASTHMEARTAAVAEELRSGKFRHDPGRETMKETRNEVLRGWRVMREILVQEGQPQLADTVAHFADKMPAIRTEKQQLAQAVGSSPRDCTRHERPITR